MSSALEIRRLTAADEPLVRGLNELFAEAFNDRASYLDQPPGSSYLKTLLAKEHVFALVALVNERVVGALVAYQLDKLEQERSEVYIYDLAVAEEYRRRGIATGLIDFLRELAAERNAYVVYVQADYGDDPAIALYEKLGTREDVMHFDIPVTRR